MTKTSQIPKLYETEDTPLEQKIIHQKWHIPNIGFYWLIAEIDEDEAFGYANLNDDTMAEWGYIDISDIKSNGAVLDQNFTPKKFPDAKIECSKE